MNQRTAAAETSPQPGPTGGTDRSSGSIGAVLFDMGGVLVELGPLDELLGAALPSEEFWPRWLASPAVRRFERGEGDIEEFAATLTEEFAITAGLDEVVERFRSFPRGLFPGAATLAVETGRRVVTGVLSNTNRLHWERQRDAETIQGLFDHRFLSYELGLVKPDAEIFERVISVLAASADLDPGRILFIDDNQVNVDGARTVGLLAERAVGVAATRQALVDYGVL